MAGALEIFGIGGDDAPEAQGSADPGPNYQDMWSNYSRWRSEEGAWYSGERSRVKAEMASSGVRSGTQGWNDRLASVDAEYNKRLADLDNTETARMLNQNWRDVTGGGGENMLSWYESQFGKSQIAQSGEGDSTGRGAGGAQITSRWLSQNSSDVEEPWLAT